MVGDRSHDVVGAREHGIDCIGVRLGLRRCPGELERGRPGAICARRRRDLAARARSGRRCPQRADARCAARGSSPGARCAGCCATARTRRGTSCGTGGSSGFKAAQPARDHPRASSSSTAASSVYARRGYGRLVLGRWVHLGVEHRAALPRGHADARRQERLGPRHLDQLLPRRRDRRQRADRRRRLHLRLRPPLRRPDHADQGPGHRQVAGAHRARRVARHEGHRVPRRRHRRGHGRRRERRRHAGPAGVQRRRRRAGAGDQGPQALD